MDNYSHPIYNSKERDAFYGRAGLPYWNGDIVIGNNTKIKPYALYTCRQESPELLEEIRKASVLVGETYDEIGRRFDGFSEEDRLKLGFHKDYLELLKLEPGEMFCSRIGWANTPDGLKMLEINTEKPTFWIEAERGNRLLSEHFGMSDANPGTHKLLSKALDHCILDTMRRLKQPPDQPKIGYIVRNNIADLQNMRWLYLQSSFYGEALTIDKLDFTKHDDKPFNRTTGTEFDGLIFWYPFEYTNELRFNDGKKLIDVMLSGLTKQSFGIVHGLAAFRLQPKTILAYITDNGDDLFKGDLAEARQYFTQTALDPAVFGDDYFAKPIWGREGQGCYRVIGGKPEYSKLQDSFYVKQNKIFQELLTLPTAKIGDRELTVVYESWIYHVNGKVVPGAIGIRASDNTITDVLSYFLPIGI